MTTPGPEAPATGGAGGVEPPEADPTSRISPERKRGLVVAACTAAAIVVALAILIPQVVQQSRDANIPAASGGPNLASVDLREDIPRDHTEAEIDYPEVPPSGGAHSEEWETCGLYTKAVREENAVHSLEHGAVWITYDPDEVTRAEAKQLYARLPDDKGLVSPYVGLPGPVVVTVWGAQLVLDSPRDPRLQMFLDEYGDGHLAPENANSCVNGVEKFETSGGGAPE